MAGYIGSKSSVTLVDGYTEAEADAEFVNDPNGAITVDGSNVGIGTSSPNYKLEVYKSSVGNVASFNSSSGNRSLDITSADNGAYLGAEWDRNINSAGGIHTWSVNDTERMRIDSSGNVGIGNTSSGYIFTAGETRLSVGDGAEHAGIQVLSGTNKWGGLEFADDTTNSNAQGLIAYYHPDNYMQFKTNGTERMRIDSSGNTRGGETTNYRGSSNDGLGAWSLGANGNLVGAVYQDIPIIANRMGNDGYAVSIRRRGTQIGGINISGTTTQYITSSDYRLKENLVDLTGASARVNQLNPLRFNWITDDTNTAIDGFLAHEVATVVPEAINGTKDAMRDEEYEVTPAVEATYDEDGNELTAAVEAVMGTRSVPDYQGIDQSKLVPLLTAALQEALTEIASLKTRVEALEA